MAKYTLDEVNDMYVDVLKEIGNVGSGNAATAIANMVGTRIDMKVPNVKYTLPITKKGTYFHAL